MRLKGRDRQPKKYSTYVRIFIPVVVRRIPVGGWANDVCQFVPDKQISVSVGHKSSTETNGDQPLAGPTHTGRLNCQE